MRGGVTQVLGEAGLEPASSRSEDECHIATGLRTHACTTCIYGNHVNALAAYHACHSSSDVVMFAERPWYARNAER